MLENQKLKSFLFLDIETVSQHRNWDEVNPLMQEMWQNRTDHYKPTEIPNDAYYEQKAAVYAEFAKVVCISIGVFDVSANANTPAMLRLKSWANHSEAELLQAFAELLRLKFGSPNKHILCGHNIKEFDVPFLCRRMLINNIPIPSILNVANLKPWEVPYIDTMHLWRFGEFRNYTSLRLLCSVLNIPNPKTELQGNMVGTTYWNENDLPKIKHYCEQDVVAVAQLILRFKNLPLLQPHEIISV